MGKLLLAVQHEEKPKPFPTNFTSTCIWAVKN